MFYINSHQKNFNIKDGKNKNILYKHNTQMDLNIKNIHFINHYHFSGLLILSLFYQKNYNYPIMKPKKKFLYMKYLVCIMNI